MATGFYSLKELDKCAAVEIASTYSLFCVGVTEITEGFETAAESFWEGLFSVSVKTLVCYDGRYV